MAKAKPSAAELKARFESRSTTASEKYARTTQEAKATPEADIKSNTFFKILFDKSTSAEEKSEAIEKALTFEGTKAENAARIAEFEALKQYLQLQRQRMAKEFMNLADTKSFSELKQVIDEMNGGLIEFDRKMKPLADILDAVYQLRTGGEDLLINAYQDIEAEKEAEAERRAKLEAAQKELDGIQTQIKQKTDRIADLTEDKSWFGWGSTKKKARQQINREQYTITELQQNATGVREKLEVIRTGSDGYDSMLPPEYADAKAKLRDLLDISSQEHTQRQRDLIDAARSFVEHAQERTSSVLVHLENMDKRIENVADANTALRSMYAIMDDASKNAASTNKNTVDEFIAQKQQQGLSSVKAMELDNNITSINEHITNLDHTAVDTSRTLTDLSEQGGRITTMKGRTRSQIAKTRSQMTSGIGGVADRLVGVLSAVSLASLSESSELMADSIQAMDRKTRERTSQEVFQRVLGQKFQNDELTQALEDAGRFKEDLVKGTALYREQVAETHHLVNEMSQGAEELREAVDAVKGAHASAREEAEQALRQDSTQEDTTAETEADDRLDNPFTKLGQ